MYFLEEVEPPVGIRFVRAREPLKRRPERRRRLRVQAVLPGALIGRKTHVRKVVVPVEIFLQREGRVPTNAAGIGDVSLTGIGRRCATTHYLTPSAVVAWAGHDILNVTAMLRPAAIHLVGPGGAGKSTVGHALAKRLGIAFIDLDEEFKARTGDITTFMNANGYHAYAKQNVCAYVETLVTLQEKAVIALSSGFMTYDSDVHAAYLELRAQIASSQTTFVLLASLDYEVCVRETVRRQLTRPFCRSAEREEEVIRRRFGAYCQLSPMKVETLGPIDAVVDRLLVHLRHTIPSPLP